LAASETRTAGNGQTNGDNQTDEGRDDADDDEDAGASPQERAARLAESLRIARRERNAARRENATLKAESQRGLTDAERVTARLAELEKENAQLKAERLEERKKTNVLGGIGNANVKNGERFYRLYSGDIEFNDDGEPNNLAAVLREARKETPELFAGAGAADGGAGTNGQTAPRDMNRLIRQAAGRE
jgi:hypothetical protein